MNKKKSPGKSIHSGQAAKGRTEKDIDDLVHEEEDKIPTELGEQDPDDLVHSKPATRSGNVDESLADPDDLVHGDMNEEEDK